ncbi:S1 family peptidase [Aeromonas schubertii]|uniref:Serine protease n=1 Tax=Aeromonas schubertii TaxID=652 RepID=A0ABS7VD82_9GAMM|nr:serine protease [Aeromonas schubertii]MBZ6067344.1 serine protease [Aeromonas schubertii]
MSLFKQSTIALACLAALPAAAGEAAPRIIGGTAVAAPSWMVAVGENVNGKWINYCGGTLIDKEWVVTAAHCVEEPQIGKMEVAIGVSDISKPHTRTAVDQVLMNTEYLINRLKSLGEEIPTFEKDIALLHLATPVTQAPIKVAALGTKDTWTTGTTPLRAYGYGGINPDATLDSPVLQTIELPYQGSKDIWYRDPTLSHIFAGKTVGQDSCKGDSGGPLVYNGELVGITSYGAFPCASGSAGAYTYAPALADWIDEQKSSVTLTSLRGLNVPAKQSRWAEFRLVNRTIVPTTLSDLKTTAPEITNDCMTELKPGQACTIRVRFEGKYTVDTMRPELVSITSTQLGRATVLEAGLIGVTTKEEPVVIPVPQPEPQPSPQPAPQPAATSSGGGGGAFGLAGLLLLPLAWLRRRR